MKLNEIKKLEPGQAVVADMGYKFMGAKVRARYKRTETVPGLDGMEELCIVEPYEIIEDKFRLAHYCMNHNMLIQPVQILNIIKEED